MKFTSWPSVKDTAKPGPGLGLNGTPVTVPLSVRISIKGYWNRTHMSDWRFRVWDAISKAKHLFGRHTLVPSEHWEFNKETGEAMVLIEGVICWLCDYRIG